MNHIITSSAPLTMTSREIADLTGKDHDNVRRDIRILAEQLSLSFEEKVLPSDGGRPSKVFYLPKRETLILVSGYSVELRARIIDRWQELESGVVPKTYAQALRLAADQQDEIDRQQLALAQAAPKVAFVDRYVESTGGKGFRQVCKLLGAEERRFRMFLREEGVMYMLGGEWMPHQRHIDAGRFEVKAGTSEVSGHAFNTAKFTPKGVEWVSRLWREHEGVPA